MGFELIFFVHELNESAYTVPSPENPRGGGLNANLAAMLRPAEQLFGQLKTAAQVRSLIGQSEDIHFDCKEWPPNDNDQQKVFAKAACGLTNAEGGVLVIGMRARSGAKGEPDLVMSDAPVKDTNAVRSRVLDLVGQLVEPGIEGVIAHPVNDSESDKSGFVVVYIPESDGPPRRSRKDSRFYLRIGSGTFPMEYFQIEERFGRGPHPKLELHLEIEGKEASIFDPNVMHRRFVLGLTNSGRGTAKFPSIRYHRSSDLFVDPDGIDGNRGFGLPQRPSEAEWTAFRGGVDEVIYPGETRKIAKLFQEGVNRGMEGIPVQAGPRRWSDNLWAFKAIGFECEISCEGTPIVRIKKDFAEDSHIVHKQ